MSRKKHWTEMAESPHYVHEMRIAFLKEHERADQILMSNDGIPLQAIYFSPELPGYGKTYEDEPRGKLNPPMKDVKS